MIMKTNRRNSGRSVSWLPIQILFLFLLASCTKSTNSYYTNPNPNPNPNPGKGGNTVSISGMAFSPASLTVAVGTTVTWTNNDAIAHTVTSDSSLFDSGAITASGGYGGGGTYNYTFTTAGTYNYHCTIHTMMTGKIIVQ
jgi:plastocyanin